MISEPWRQTTLGDFVSLQRGHDLPDPQRRRGRVPILGSFGITGYHDTPKAKGPGVTVGRSGASFGVVSYSPVDYWPLNTALYVTDFNGNDERFAYYFLKTLDFTRYNSGSAQPSLNRNYIASIRIRIPPRDEQRAIASILGSLDDKIECNRRMNRTLEAMARAIFQSWFVDFDPVRAKVDGRAPAGLDAATAALFPDHFEDSELGKIPAGWKVSEIRELTSAIQYGLTQSAAQQPIGPHFLRITDIRGGNIDWSQVPYCSVTKSDFAKYQVIPGDVFVARTGASTGENVYIVDCPKAVFASYLVRFKFPHKSLARYIGQYMRTDDYFTFVSGIIGGSAQPNANAQQLALARLVVPPHTICNLFYELVQPLDKKRYVNEVESRTLATLRDTLLPKLISGELRVPEAEQITEKAE